MMTNMPFSCTSFPRDIWEEKKWSLPVDFRCQKTKRQQYCLGGLESKRRVGGFHRIYLLILFKHHSKQSFSFPSFIIFKGWKLTRVCLKRKYNENCLLRCLSFISSNEIFSVSEESFPSVFSYSIKKSMKFIFLATSSSQKRRKFIYFILLFTLLALLFPSKGVTLVALYRFWDFQFSSDFFLLICLFSIFISLAPFGKFFSVFFWFGLYFIKLGVLSVFQLIFHSFSLFLSRTEMHKIVH